MRFTSSVVSLLACVSATWAVTYPGPGAISGSYNIHDPTMCKNAAGKYFVFGTAPGIQILTSTDRTKWTNAGLVWPNGASWTDKYTLTTNGNIWAPDCTFANGQFYLYYAASSFGSRNSAIFLATSTTGASGSWKDHGLVVATTQSNTYNAIDPNLSIDGSNWWLTFGSFQANGIQRTPIDPSTGKPTGAQTTIARRSGSTQAVEGPSMFQVGSYWYLFTSWDACCQGVSSTYNIRVGRSTSPSGSFVDNAGVALTSGGGTLVLPTHDAIYGPGGQDLMNDGDGVIMVYHHYTSTASVLGINRLDFSSGWPVVV